MSPLKKFFALSSLTLLSACASNPQYTLGHSTEEHWNTAALAPTSPTIQPMRMPGKLKPRKTAAFTAIETDVPATYQIQEGTHRIAMTGSATFLKHLHTKVEAKTLVISLDPKLSNKEHALLETQLKTNIIHINAPTLTALYSQGLSNITLLNMPGSIAITKNGPGPLNAQNLVISKLQVGKETPLTITKIISFSTPELTVNDNQNILLSGNDIQFQKINKTGAGTLTVTGLSSQKLAVNNSGHGVINLTSSGDLNINQITATGDSQLYITPVSGNNLTIKADNHSIIGLQGHVQNLTAQLSDQADLLARTLKAENIIIKTTGQAHANIRPMDTTGIVHASASDKSNLYIFGQPKHIFRSQENLGVVLGFADYPSKDQ